MAKRTNKGRRPKPGFEFGIFDFAEFADWLAGRYERCARWLMETSEVAVAEMDEDSPLAQAYQSKPLSVAIDTAYLSMLALAVTDSIREDLVDHREDADALLWKEPFRRARYMLRLHADRLPVRVDRAMLDERASLVGGLLMWVAMFGFDCKLPVVRNAAKKMPVAVRSAWKKHKYAEEPLCQLMAMSFWLGFRAMITGRDQGRQWRRVLGDFWDGWCNHLLDVDYALREEDLQANEKLDRRKGDANA